MRCKRRRSHNGTVRHFGRNRTSKSSWRRCNCHSDSYTAPRSYSCMRPWRQQRPPWMHIGTPNHTNRLFRRMSSGTHPLRRRWWHRRRLG